MGIERIYLPISSENFSNILSTESISPAIFYQKRNFGIKRFRQLDKYSLNGEYITFYTFAFSLELEQSDIEAYPILFSFDSKVFKFSEIEHKFRIEAENGKLSVVSDSSEDFDLFLYPKTFYLPNPSEFAIHFKDKPEKDSTFAKLLSSLEAKNIQKYSIKTALPEKLRPYPNINKNITLKRNQYLDPQISFDRNYNHYKGFLYGFLFSELISKTKDINFFLKRLNDFNNKFAVLKNRYSLGKIGNKSNINRSSNERPLLETQPSEIENTLNILSELEKLSEKIFKEQSPEFLINDIRRNIGKFSDQEHLDPSLKAKTLERVDISTKDHLFKLKKTAESKRKKLVLKKYKIDLDWIKIKQLTPFEIKQSHKRGLIKVGKDEQIFNIIVKTFVNNPRMNKTEITKEDILQLLKNMANPIIETLNSDKDERVELLRKFYKRIEHNVSFSFDQKKYPLFEGLFKFFLHPNSLEDLLSQLNIAENNKSAFFALSFWGAFNGYARFSKNEAGFISDNPKLTQKIDQHLLDIREKFGQDS